MGCREFEDRLEAFLAETLELGERRAVESHLASCLACSELHTLARTATESVAEVSPDLTQAILAQTSGSTCDRAEEQLCDWVDGSLEPFDAELVQLHAARCDACSGLAYAMTQMARELPELAELDPGPGFATAVMRSTVPLGRRVSRSLDQRFFRHLERFALGLRDVMDRPRIALEGAYLGTVVLAFVFLTPGSPLADVPKLAADLARLNPVAELRAPVSAVESRVSSGAQSLWNSSGRRVVDKTRNATALTIEKIESDLGTLWNRAASSDVNEEMIREGESK